MAVCSLFNRMLLLTDLIPVHLLYCGQTVMIGCNHTSFEWTRAVRHIYGIIRHMQGLYTFKMVVVDLLLNWVVRGQFDILMSHFSKRFLLRTVLFRKVYIPKGRFSELYLVLWSVRLIIRRVIAPKILIPKCHCSERFLVRKVFILNGFFFFFFFNIPNGFWSERF